MSVTLGDGDYQYRVVRDWAKLPEGWDFREVAGVATDSKDNVYVFNRGTHPVVVFDSEGNLLRTWGDGVFTNPHGITIGPDDSVYCVDNGDHSVRKFSLEGKPLLTLQAGHPAPLMSGDPFNKPTHLALDPNTGDMYVADGYSNARVHKYSPDGRLLFSWGESGTDPGQFNIVHNITTDREGLVYIADRENQRVQVFDPNGKFLAQWENLSRAACICMYSTDNPLVYVGEYFCGIGSNATGTNLGPRVSVMDTGGKILARLSDQSYGDEPGRFYAPHGIAVDSKGSIYVAEVSWSEFGHSMEPPREPRSLQKLIKKG